MKPMSAAERQELLNRPFPRVRYIEGKSHAGTFVDDRGAVLSGKLRRGTGGSPIDSAESDDMMDFMI